MFECNEDQTGNKWMQYATDVVAVIFVADASAYDVVKCNGVDAATGEEIYREVQLDLTPEIEVQGQTKPR